MAVRETIEFGWWVEIKTDKPPCIYYFGNFDNYREAESAVNGYVEDLFLEGAELLEVNVKNCQPQAITIYAEELDSVA